MSQFFELLWTIICCFFERRTQQAKKAWEEENWLDVAISIGIIVVASLVGIAVPIFLVYRLRPLIAAIAMPVLVVAILIASFYENSKGDATPIIRGDDASINEVRARAERTHPIMKQTVYLLFCELCQYLPGLVKPFSLGAVTGSVKFDVTASLVPVYHFILMKGENETPVSTVKEILENLIEQHLYAQDLPLTIPAVYASSDGNSWPGLVVDGIYDMGQYYRVDLVITNEAAISRLKTKDAARLEGSVTITTPCDPDFD